MSFVHLNCYSDYSLLHSTLAIDKLIGGAHRLGQPAIALTDKNNLFGVMEFIEKLERLPDLEKGGRLKGIVGVELSIKRIIQAGENFSKVSAKHPATHPLVLLAENNTGYHNLVALVSKSYANTNNKNPQPQVDFAFLQQHREGIIILCGGMESEVAFWTQKNELKKVDEYLALMSGSFSSNYFYVQIQNHHHPEEAKVNKIIEDRAKANDIPLVATNQVCYLNKEDAGSYEVLLAIGEKRTVDMEQVLEPGNTNVHSKILGSGYHLKTKEEMLSDFPHSEAAILNSLQISERCHVDIIDKKIHIPSAQEIFNIKDKTSEEILIEQSKERLKQKGLTSPVYLERLDYELSVIMKMGFPDYFLIVADFVAQAKAQGIFVGVGRGSAAGSLVSYVLDITSIDPIRYGLLFERFLNPERRSMPDIDIDFQEDRRGEVVEYIKKKYGEEKVAQIITFGKLKTKAIFKDTARVFGMSFEQANEISKKLSGQLSERDKQNKGSRSLLQFYFEENIELVSLLNQDKKLQAIYDNALKLENLTRQTGIHAAGVVVADKNINHYIPTFKNEDGVTLTQFEGMYLEGNCGLLKIDILGLKTLTILSECLKSIKETYDQDVDIDKVDLQDKKTYRLYAQGLTIGVFQFESGGMVNYLKDLKPNKFDDLVAMNALYRPGPMSWIPVYIARKNKLEPKFENEQSKENYYALVSLCEKYPPLMKVLNPTNSIPIFQEQIMEISKEFAGFSLGEADSLRKAMGKKDKKLIQKIRKDFLSGALANNNAQSDAEFLYDKIIEPFGGYGFNKSHSVSYSFLSFQTAFLKANFPVCFMTASLNSEITGSSNSKKIPLYIKEIQKLNLEVLPIDINRSGVEFINHKKIIIYGLSAIKSIGANLARHIVREREKNGSYKNIGDFIYRNNQEKVNKQAVEALVKVGAFDGLGISSAKIFPHLGELSERIEKEKNSQSKGQANFFEQSEELASESVYQDIIDKMRDALDNPSEAKKLESEILGFNMRNNLFSKNNLNLIEQNTTLDFDEESTWKNWSTHQVAGAVEDIRIIHTKKDNKEMAILKVNNGRNTFNVICFNKNWEGAAKKVCQINEFYKIEVRLKEEKFNQEDRFSLVLNKIEKLSLSAPSEKKETGKETTNPNTYTELHPKEVVLKINPHLMSDEYLNEIREFIENSKGKTALSFFMEDHGVKKKIPTGKRVKIDDDFKFSISSKFKIDDYRLVE